MRKHEKHFSWLCATIKLFFLIKRLKFYLFCYLPRFAGTFAVPHNFIMPNKKALLEYNGWVLSFIRIIVFHHTSFSIFFL